MLLWSDLDPKSWYWLIESPFSTKKNRSAPRRCLGIHILRSSQYQMSSLGYLHHQVLHAEVSVDLYVLRSSSSRSALGALQKAANGAKEARSSQQHLRVLDFFRMSGFIVQNYGLDSAIVFSGRPVVIRVEGQTFFKDSVRRSVIWCSLLARKCTET